MTPDRFAADAMHVPVSVHEAASGGYWSADGAEGYFRIVVLAAGVEHTTHRLYVQLIAVSIGDPDSRLVSSVAVDEINQGHGVTLNVVPDFSEFGEATVSIAATPRGGGVAQHYVLTVTSDGSYELSPE